MPRSIRIGDRTMYAVNDGVLRPPRSYFDPPSTFDRLADEHGAMTTPIGAFLWPGELSVLIDAGVGPVDYRGLGLLVGGELLDELRAVGFTAADIDIVAVSHLHPDHIGWLASAAGTPTFPNATIVIAQSDWQHFLIDHTDEIDEHLAYGLSELFETGRVRLVDGEHDVARGIRLMPAPGHTPGHSVFAIEDHADRLVLLGDAIFCPLQLTEHDIGVQSDLDPIAARRTRIALSRTLEHHRTRALGCHFPGLIDGRILAGAWAPAENDR